MNLPRLFYDYDLHIIDGNNFAHRAAYVATKVSSKTPPQHLAAMFLRVQKVQRGPRTVLVLDHPGPSWRNILIPKFKAIAARPEIERLVDLSEELAPALGWTVLRIPEFEADDVIMACSRGALIMNPSWSVLVSSPDKDMVQLFQESVTIEDMKGVAWTYERVHEKFGVAPNRIRDYLALAGDASDGISGVRGCGPKTAQKILEMFPGGVREILAFTANPREILEFTNGLRGKARGIVRRLLYPGSDARKSLKISWELVGLRCDIDVSYALRKDTAPDMAAIERLSNRELE